MKITDLIKRLVRDYFIIFTVLVTSITVLRQIFSPNAYLELKDIFIYMLCALVSDLPGLILYSSREISEKEMRLRIILHFAALEGVILTLANVLGLIKGFPSTIMLAVQVALIYALVRFIIWMDDRRSADRINAKLQAIKNELGDITEEE